MASSCEETVEEGWFGDDYLILFSPAEIAVASESYALTEWLPGFELLGLRNWDDFIVRDSSGQVFVVPTVPATATHLEAFVLSNSPVLEDDGRLRGKIKWYVQPIVFGGNPQSPENIIWLDHAQHAGAVKWWNEMHRRLTTLQAGTNSSS